MEFINYKWNKRSYYEYVNYLTCLEVKENSKKFTTNIYNDKIKETLGIKIPILRSIAKEILKTDVDSFILQALKDSKYVEEDIILGFVIALKKENMNSKFINIQKFIPKITSWAICDSFVPSLKCVKKYRKEYLEFIEKFIDENNEFSTRFFIVSLLDYYIEDDTIDYVLNKLNSLHSDYYYIKMAIAWAICEAYIYYPEKTKNLLLNNDIDNFTFNKAISKICDSYRITKENKEILKKLRR